MRTRTVQNKTHPHNILKAFQHGLRVNLRKESNEELAKYGGPPMSRSRKIKAIVEECTLRFKEMWEKDKGWPFDDCYNEAKLTAHLCKTSSPKRIKKLPLASS